VYVQVDLIVAAGNTLCLDINPLDERQTLQADLGAIDILGGILRAFELTHFTP
jgi:hypothetical protein